MTEIMTDVCNMLPLLINDTIKESIFLDPVIKQVSEQSYLALPENIYNICKSNEIDSGEKLMFWLWDWFDVAEQAFGWSPGDGYKQLQLLRQVIKGKIADVLWSLTDPSPVFNTSPDL
jgi:hypothetical protein